MHTNEALLIGAVFKLHAAHEMRCVLLTAPIETYAITYDDVKQNEVAFPGYPAGGIAVDNALVGSAFDGPNGMEVILLGQVLLKNETEEAWQEEHIHTAYYLSNSARRSILWVANRGIAVNVPPGAYLNISPVSIR